ncbi:MAG: ATP-binding cassette domain-containing protein [bacterium JZ-2024 1]
MAETIRTEKLTRIFVDRKRKREVRALWEADLSVQEGEIFGLLGPNGAGKTTLIKILTTLLLPTSGKAFVNGIDVVRYPREVRKYINLVEGGEHSGYGILTVRENLWMFSQFYGLTYKQAFERIEELLKLVGLEDEKHTRTNKLSTGMRQKLNFARGFINDPKIAFLDEPTLGMDVTSAITCRKFIKHWVKEKSGKTVLLTTHYMAEAEELCDRIAIISHGRIIACDTPRGLKARVQKEQIYRIFTHLNSEVPAGANPLNLNSIPGVLSSHSSWNPQDGTTEIRVVLESDHHIVRVLETIARNEGKIQRLEKTEPTLEDVFVTLVGRSFEEDERRIEEHPGT